MLEIVGPDQDEIRYITLEYYLEELKDRPAEYVSKKLHNIALMEYDSNKLKKILKHHKEFIEKYPEFSKKITDFEKQEQTTLESILSKNKANSLKIEESRKKGGDLFRVGNNLNIENESLSKAINKVNWENGSIDSEIQNFKTKNEELSQKIKKFNNEIEVFAKEILEMRTLIDPIMKPHNDFITRATQALEKEKRNNELPPIKYLPIEKEFMKAAIAEKKEDDGAAVMEMLRLHEGELKRSPEIIKHLLEEHQYYMYKKPKVKRHLEALGQHHAHIKKPATPDEVSLAIEHNNVDEIMRAIGHHLVETPLLSPGRLDRIKIILDQYQSYISQHRKLEKYLKKIGLSQDAEERIIKDYADYAQDHPKLLEPLLDIVGPDKDETRYITLEYYLKVLEDKAKDPSESDYVTTKLKAIKFDDYENKKLQEIFKPHEKFIKQHLKGLILPMGKF